MAEMTDHPYQPIEGSNTENVCVVCALPKTFHYKEKQITDLDKRAAEFRSRSLWYPGAFGGGKVFVGTKPLLEELDWLKENPPELSKPRPILSLDFAMVKGETRGWQAALAAVRNLLKEPEGK